MAKVYNTNLWFEGKGFGFKQEDDTIKPNVPSFIERYILENSGSHYAKDHLVVARNYIEPMGIDGDTALDITINAVITLLKAVNK